MFRPKLEISQESIRAYWDLQRVHALLHPNFPIVKELIIQYWRHRTDPDKSTDRVHYICGLEDGYYQAARDVFDELIWKEHGRNGRGEFCRIVDQIGKEYGFLKEGE